MQSRRFTVPAVVAACVLTPAAAFAAFAYPAGSTNNSSFTDPVDAQSGIDITNVALYRNATQYRATVTFGDLRLQKGNRYSIAFSDPSQVSPTTDRGARPSVEAPTTAGNIVELRVAPDGTISSAAYKYDADGTTSKATCPGTRAVADFTKSHILFVIPNDCWKLSASTLSTAQVTASSRHFVPGGYQTSPVPLDTAADGTRSDTAQGTWTYGDVVSPTGSPSGSPSSTQ